MKHNIVILKLKSFRPITELNVAPDQIPED